MITASYQVQPNQLTASLLVNNSKVENILNKVQKDISLNINELDKSTLMLTNIQKIKYVLNKVEIDIQHSIDLLDQKLLEKQTPPYIPITFGIWRKKAWDNFEKTIKNENLIIQQKFKKIFIEIVDKKLLNLFINKIKEPYYTLVFQKNYNMPKSLEVSRLKNELQLYEEISGLALAVTNWLVQVELLNDIVDRAQLYGFYSPPKDKMKNIEGLGKFYVKPAFTLSRMPKRIVMYMLKMAMKELSGFFWMKGFKFTNISFSAAMGILLYIVGAGVCPWPMLLSSIKIKWIVGGFLGSKLADKLRILTEKSEQRQDISQLEKIFIRMTEKIAENNEKISNSLYQLTNYTIERELEFNQEALGYYIGNLLNFDNLFQGINIVESDQEIQLTMEQILVDSIQENEWVICDVAEYEESEVDDGYLKVSQIQKINKK